MGLFTFGKKPTPSKTPVGEVDTNLEDFVRDIDKNALLRSEAGAGPLDGLLEMLAAPFSTEAEEARGEKISDISFFSRFLPYSGWLDNEKLFTLSMAQSGDLRTKKEGVGFVLEITPLVGCSEEQSNTLSKWLNSVPPDNCDVAGILSALPKVGQTLSDWRSHRNPEEFPLLAKMAERRVQLLNSAALACGRGSGSITVRDYRVYLSLSKEGAPRPELINQLADVRRSLMQTMAEINSSSVVLEPEDLLRLAQDILQVTSDSRPAPKREPGTVSLRQMISNMDCRFEAKEDRVEIKVLRSGSPDIGGHKSNDQVYFEEEWEARALYAAKFPPRSFQANMSLLLGDPSSAANNVDYPWVSSFSFRIKSRSESTTIAELKAMRTGQASSASWAKSFPEMAEKAQDWSDVRQLVADGGRMIECMYSLVVFAPKGLGDKAEAQMRSLYSQRQWELQSARPVVQNMFLSVLPMMWSTGYHNDLKQLGLLRTMTTDHAVHLMPLQGERGPQGSPIMMLVQRRGALAYFDPFSNVGDGNHNVAMWGGSGSGKSFALQDLVASSIGAGIQVTVIDQGRSFMSMCEVLGGQFVDLSPGLVMNLNPFPWFYPEAEKDPEYATEMRQAIRLIIQQMAFGDLVPDRERLGIIDEAVGVVWNRDGEKGSIEAVANELRKVDGIGVSLVRQLSAYIGNGVYAGIFNGFETQSFDKAMTVFEFGSSSSQPELNAVVMLAVLSVTRLRMRAGGREQRKMLVIDEGWQLLGNGAAGEFIEMMARTVRKENGALVTATQSIEDFYKTSAARAAYENSNWKFMLRQSGESVDRAVKEGKLMLSAYDLMLIKSITMRKGQFSEAFISGPNMRSLVRVVVDELSGVLFSSDPEIFTEVRRRRAAGEKYEDILPLIADHLNQVRSRSNKPGTQSLESIIDAVRNRVQSGQDISQALKQIATENEIIARRQING